MSTSAWSVGAAGVRRHLSQEEVDKVKEVGYIGLHKVGDFVCDVAAVITGYSIIAGNGTLRKTADILLDSGNYVHDKHCDYVVKVRKTPFLFKSLKRVEPRTLPNKA